MTHAFHYTAIQQLYNRKYVSSGMRAFSFAVYAVAVCTSTLRRSDRGTVGCLVMRSEAPSFPLLRHDGAGSSDGGLLGAVRGR